MVECARARDKILFHIMTGNPTVHKNLSQAVPEQKKKIISQKVTFSINNFMETHFSKMELERRRVCYALLEYINKMNAWNEEVEEKTYSLLVTSIQCRLNAAPAHTTAWKQIDRFMGTHAEAAAAHERREKTMTFFYILLLTTCTCAYIRIYYMLYYIIMYLDEFFLYIKCSYMQSKGVLLIIWTKCCIEKL